MALLTKIRTQVALVTRHKTSAPLAGTHASVSVGRSTEFNDLREYVAGDEVADIDWRASARHGSLLVARHVASRRTALLLAVATGQDLAGIAAFDGTAGCKAGIVTKRDLAIGVAGVFGLVATRHGDQVGLVWSSGGVARVRRPSAREVALEASLQTIHDACTPDSPPADLDAVLAAAASATRRRGVVAVIADDVDIDASLVARLRRLRAQHDVSWVTLPDADPTEARLRRRALVGLDDRRLFDSAILADPGLADEVACERRARAARRSRALASLAVPHLGIDANGNLAAQVLGFVTRNARG